MEASRRHGPFDTRWPGARKDSSDAVPTAPDAVPTGPPLRAAEAAEALDWRAFSARYFPERRRHDSESRSAYTAYRLGREWRTTPARLRLVPSEHIAGANEQEPEEAGTRRLLAAMVAVHPREAQSALPS